MVVQQVHHILQCCGPSPQFDVRFLLATEFFIDVCSGVKPGHPGAYRGKTHTHALCMQLMKAYEDNTSYSCD